MSSSEDHILSKRKSLRGKHPLYTRMSGDVVWELLQECGFDDNTCGETMDRIIAEMHRVLDVMDALETDSTKYLGYTLNGPACEGCKALTNCLIPATGIKWYNCLPPFAIGCGLGCIALSAHEATKANVQDPTLHICDAQSLTLPPRALLCPLLDQQR